MASVLDSAIVIGGFGSTQTTTPAKTQETAKTDFSDLLGQLKQATKATTSTDTVKYNPISAAFKRVLFSYVDTGMDAAKAELNSLSDSDKTSLYNQIQSFASAVQKELDGTGAGGSAQKALNNLLKSADASPDSNSSVGQDALDRLQRILAGLDDDDSTDVSSILSQLLPALLSLNSTTTSTTTQITYPDAVSGMVSISNGMGTTYHLTLQDCLDALTSFSNVLLGIETPVVPVPVVPVIPPVIVPTDPTTPTDPTGGTTPPTDDITDPTTPTDPAGETPPPTDETGETTTPPDTTGDITPPTDGTATPPAEGTDPTAPTGETGGTGGTAETENPPMQEATIQTFNSQRTAQAASGTPDKLTSEGSVAKAVLFSQRLVQKSGELETLTLDTANAAALTAQPVFDVQSLGTAQTVGSLPVETQIVNNLYTSLTTLGTGKTTEMTMTLNPDNLGKISVNLANTDGKITVTLAALSETTQKLLQDKLPSLIANLQNANPDVKDVRVVDASQSALFAQLNLGSSGKDAQSGSYSSNTAQPSGTLASDQAAPLDDTPAEYKGGNRLWQTA